MDWGLIFFTIIYAILNGLSASIQKYGLAQVDLIDPVDFIKKPLKTLQTLLKSKYWILGNLSGLGSFIVMFVFIAYADLSIVTPLLNVNLVVVILVGIFILKEKITRFELVSVFFLIFGLIVLSSEQHLKSYNADQYLLFVYLIVGVLVGILLIGIPKISCSKTKKSKEELYALSAGLFYGLSAVYANALVVLDQISIDLFEVSSWLLILSPYFLIFITMNIIAFFAYQGALSHGRSSVVFLTMNCVGILVPVLAGIIIFKEPFFVFPYLRVIGISLVLIGIVLTSIKKEN